MSIFTKSSYSKKYLLTHPWCILRHLKEDIVCAWQRASKGYCYRDLWEINNWFLDIMSRMITEFKETTHGYPLDFKDLKEWKNELGQLSFLLKSAHGETSLEAKNIRRKALEKFMKNFDDLWD